jgi:N-acetylmuramoyl-L-alanine amidase
VPTGESTPAVATAEQRRMTEVFYLGFVAWREARGETREVKLGVVFSILNRVASPKWWGTDISSVVIKPWQYSSMTNPHDLQLTKFPLLSHASWLESLQVAIEAYDGCAANSCPGADSYHDVSISAPGWARPEAFVCQLGRIRFFNTDGDHPENEAP